MDFSSYHIGVFDSGVGGRHVALSLQRELPGIKVTALSDSKNIPYGKKNPAQMLECAMPFMARFEALGVDAIVIACNTCFVNIKFQLKQLTKIPIIGFEPPLAEAAAKTVSGTVAICATQGTLSSDRWQVLKAEQSPDLEIVEIDCTDWVALIEADKLRQVNLQVVIDQVIEAGADQLILGCTHYHWVAADILKLIPADYQLGLCEPTEKVIGQLTDVLGRVANRRPA